MTRNTTHDRIQAHLRARIQQSEQRLAGLVAATAQALGDGDISENSGLEAMRQEADSLRVALRYPDTGLVPEDLAVLNSGHFFIQSLAQVPAESHVLTVRSSNVDDVSEVFLNGQRMFKLEYTGESDVVDLSRG